MALELERIREKNFYRRDAHRPRQALLKTTISVPVKRCPLSAYPIYAEAASRFSALAGCKPDTGLRNGRTSAATVARHSTLPITGRSGAPASDNDTNLFSLHNRSISRRSRGRSTCCGSEKKFLNVQIRCARCIKVGCMYRDPTGVSSATTPSMSLSIHIS
jgi:hypothetical protein